MQYSVVFDVLYTKHLTQKNKRWIDGQIVAKNQMLYLRDDDCNVLEAFYFNRTRLRDCIYKSDLHLVQFEDERQAEALLRACSEPASASAQRKRDKPVSVPSTPARYIKEVVEPVYKVIEPVRIDEYCTYLYKSVDLVVPFDLLERYYEDVQLYTIPSAVKTVAEMVQINLQQLMIETLFKVFDVLTNAKTVSIKAQLIYSAKYKQSTERVMLHKLDTFSFSKYDLLIVRYMPDNYALFIIDQYDRKDQSDLYLAPLNKFDQLKAMFSRNRTSIDVDCWLLPEYTLLYQYVQKFYNLLKTKTLGQCSELIVQLMMLGYGVRHKYREDEQEFKLHDSYTLLHEGLNSFQLQLLRSVVESFMPGNTQRFFLVRGIFGSGKSLTIVNVIKQMFTLFGAQFRVLVTAVTNTAIDNVLSRISTCGIQAQTGQKLFYRIGSGCQTEELKQYVTGDPDYSVMCTFVTCASVYKCENLKFDLVIVDEASYMKDYEFLYIASCVQADRIMLCGDPAYLPPVTSNFSIQKSLFQRLIEGDNEVVTLWIQYRCNQYLASLSSALFYNSNVRTESDIYTACYNEKQRELQEAYQAAKRTVKPDGKINIIKQIAQYYPAMPPFCSFLLKSTDERSFGSRINRIEADVICKFVKHLLATGFHENEIGIITPYKAQAQLLTNNINRQIQIQTVDSFQGSEKNIIIFSHTKTDTSSNDAFIENGCRINVALTRAKYSFVLFTAETGEKGYWYQIHKYCAYNNLVFEALPDFIEWQYKYSAEPPPSYELFKSKAKIVNGKELVLKCQKQDEDYMNWHYWCQVKDHTRMCFDSDFSVPDLLQLMEQNRIAKSKLLLDMRPIPEHDQLLDAVRLFSRPAD